MRSIVAGANGVGRGPGTRAMLEDILVHLKKAQELMDRLEPDSIMAARTQHIIDEVEERISARGRPQHLADGSPEGN
jgi:hypothetical protein